MEFIILLYMDLVKRRLRDVLKGYLFKNKTLIVYGARQTGKTTLVDQLLTDYTGGVLWLNGDDYGVREIFEKPDSVKLEPVVKGYDVIVIDEAQRIPECGLVLKIIYDSFRGLQVVATGSSSFELAGSIQEPMTGRKLEFNLYPLSFKEMADHHGFLKEKRLIEHRLKFGYYPDVVLNTGDEKKILKSLASSYLYKDILSLESIKKPALLEKILKALALQIGSEVSYSEIARLTGCDKGTVERYMDLLEKSYIIYSIKGFSGNLRNEIKKNSKVYFFDNGIRSVAAGDLSGNPSPTEMGHLWENFLITERRKLLENSEKEFSQYFWRTTQQQEIDYVEKREGRVYAFEFKWNSAKRAKGSKTFFNAYPEAEFKVISPDNVHKFLLEV